MSRQAGFDFGLDADGRKQSFLLTGGTGFIGSVLVSALLGAGHEVSLWSRNPQTAEKLFGNRVACVASLEDFPEGKTFDIVVNLAGAPTLGARWTDARKRLLIDSRVRTTHTFIDWLERSGRKPARMISASAIGYYGFQAPGGMRTIDEDVPAQNDFAAQLCRQWERAAEEIGRLGVPLDILRFGIVLGRQGGALPSMMRATKLGLGSRWGSGQQILSWVHVDDVIGVIAWCCRKLDETPGGAYNVVAPQLTTQNAFNRVCAASVHRPAWLVIPSGALRLLLGERASMLLEGARIVPARLLEEGYVFRHPDLGETLRQLVSGN